MPVYCTDRSEAQRLVQNAELDAQKEVILDLRNNTFCGTAFSDTLALELLMRSTTRVILRGGKHRIQERLRKYCANYGIPSTVKRISKTL